MYKPAVRIFAKTKLAFVIYHAYSCNNTPPAKHVEHIVCIIFIFNAVSILTLYIPKCDTFSFKIVSIMAQYI